MKIVVYGKSLGVSEKGCAFRFAVKLIRNIAIAKSGIELHVSLPATKRKFIEVNHILTMRALKIWSSSSF